MKKTKNSKNKNKVAVSVDSRIYSRESLLLASRIFSSRLVVGLRQSGSLIDVTLQTTREAGPAGGLPSASGEGLPLPCDSKDGGLEFLAGEFFNEALNQECRLILSRENANIQKMLITKAFLSARSVSRNSQGEQLSAAKKKAFEREAKKLLMRAKREMAVQGRTAVRRP